MLTLLSGRLAKGAEVEGSGSDERTAPSPLPRRRKRRSRRGSASANAGNVDSDSPTPSTTNTPVPHPSHSHSPDAVAELRNLLVTPIQASSRSQGDEHVADAPFDMMEAADSADTGLPRSSRHRDSVLIEEDESDSQDEINGDVEEESDQIQQSPPRLSHTRFPSTPSRLTPNPTVIRAPHSSDIPSQVSIDSEMVPGAIGVPMYLSHHTRSGSDAFPASPFTIPFKERPSEEEEEEVLYHPDVYRSRTPYTDIHTDGHGREISWVGEPGEYYHPLC
jgi:serine/arginine repetitive matrix protein 2